MHPPLREWLSHTITEPMVRGKRVIEVGCIDSSGSSRGFIEPFQPLCYITNDMRESPNVQLVGQFETLNFDRNFDLVICTETIEHAKHWPQLVLALKRACVPGGTLILTGRSPGMYYHGWPDDYWRFTTADVAKMLADFDIQEITDEFELEYHERLPGFYALARRPLEHVPQLIDFKVAEAPSP